MDHAAQHELITVMKAISANLSDITTALHENSLVLQGIHQSMGTRKELAFYVTADEAEREAERLRPSLKSRQGSLIRVESSQPSIDDEYEGVVWKVVLYESTWLGDVE